MRRSLVADQDIAEGEVITEEKLAIKRPDEGISAIHFWDQCGKKAKRDYESGELILP
jgi:N-acetylneuraminate synthase